MLGSVRNGRASVIAILAVGASITFVTAVAIISAETYKSAYEEYATNHVYDEAKREFRDRCVGLEGEEIFRCLEGQIETAREPPRAEEDLSAQKQMARWALGTLIISLAVGFASTSITLIGVVLVRDTLEATRAGTNAVRDANKITETAFALEQRPWLKVSVSLLSPITVTNNDVSVEMRATVVNVGKTPALNALIRFAAFDINTRHPAIWASFINKVIDAPAGTTGDALVSLVPSEDFSYSRYIVFPRNKLPMQVLAGAAPGIALYVRYFASGETQELKTIRSYRVTKTPIQYGSGVFVEGIYEQGDVQLINWPDGNATT